MSQLPILKARKLIKIVNSLGFSKVRQEGAHIFFRHPDGRTTVIPFHAGKDIGKGLLRAILNDIKLTPKYLQKLL
jgi:predicted RNA binding protein YcfA (HicA-like mRNA interferase family)